MGICGLLVCLSTPVIETDILVHIRLLERTERRKNMGLFDIFKKNQDSDNLMPKYLYNDKELAEVEAFISKTFGEYEEVFHEFVSPDVHLDVCCVLPTDEEPFYKLVTLGAGAYKMKVPAQYKKYNIERAEYVIYVPVNWNLQSSDMKDYWPMKVLKDVARLPIWCDTWLSYGHTTQADEAGTPYAENTRFNSVVLDTCENNQEDVRLELSSGKVINFYQVIPLYPEELNFKMENGAQALFDTFDEKKIDCKVLDLNRESAV